MMSGRDIIYISSIEWNFLWQGPQEIAQRLAAAGNRLLYIENTGVRAPGLHDAGRVARRLQRWVRAGRAHGVRHVAPNIYVCSPLVLPPFGARWQREANRQIFLPWVRQAARHLGMREVLLWTYLPTDTTVDLINLLREPASAVIYYCVADFTQLSPHRERLRRIEQELVTRSDLVFTNCSTLAASFARWQRHVHVFPVGVNLDAFPLEAEVSGERGSAHGGRTRAVPASAARLRALRKPLIGYVGGMHRHVDYKLLAEMARAKPAWSWVCVGPQQTALTELAGLPNLHWLGQQPHAELVHFIRQFDVCIVPYVNSQYTRTVVPTKINEYLAVGQPVVSTALPTVCEFNREHQILLTAANDAKEFLTAIEASLALPRDSATQRRRREVAALSDWQVRLAAMNDLIESQLARRR